MDLSIEKRAAELIDREVLHATPVAGGDICRAFRLELEDGSLRFAKTPREDCPGMIREEAAGLLWLEEARALRVPRVEAAAERDGRGPALLVLEWIESGAPCRDFGPALGRGLAALHAAGANGFGMARDNFIGPLPQANGARPSWALFYAERRIAPQLRRAADRGRLAAGLTRRIEILIEEMERLTGAEEAPARLHGDLWSGNVLADESGRPCLIDPAAYGGHREIDLAMLRLFGSPAPGCLEAYQRVTGLAPGHEERVALYQLYPLLVHVNLFGGSYAEAVERAVARCETLL